MIRLLLKLETLITYIIKLLSVFAVLNLIEK